MAEFAQHAARLAENGFAPLPIPARSKGPGLENWQRYNFRPADVQRYGSHGVGLLTKYMPVADIDVRAAPLAERLGQLAVATLGPAPTRIGQAPKRALVYRTSAP